MAATANTCSTAFRSGMASTRGWQTRRGAQHHCWPDREALLREVLTPYRTRNCLGGKQASGKAMHLQTSIRHLAALCKHLVTSIHSPPRGGGQSMGFAASARRLDGSDLYAAAGLAEHPATPRRLDSVRENTLPHELRQAQRISAAAPPRRTNVADSRPSFRKSAMQPAMKSWLERPAELRRLIHLSWSYTKQIDTPLNLRAACQLEHTLASEETRCRQTPC
jgi:hypothetical protein